MRPATPQRTAEMRFAAPTPVLAPVIVWVVLTGIPRRGDVWRAAWGGGGGTGRPTSAGGAGRGPQGSRTVRRRAAVEPRAGGTRWTFIWEIPCRGRTSPAGPALAIAEPA